MDDCRCPISVPLLGKQAVCQYSEEVIRRGGSEIACSNPAANAQCQALMEHINENMVPQMGFANDLLDVPHSVLQKIQLATVSKLTGGQADSLDLADAVAAVNDRESFADAELLTLIQSMQLRKRRGR